MASKQSEGSSGSEIEEVKNEGESSPSGQKTKTSLAAKAVNIFRTVKSKISPRKGKDEQLINPPTPSPECSETSSPSGGYTPPGIEDLLKTDSSVGTEFMTDTTSAPGRSDSLSEVPEIRDIQRKDSKSCPTSEEKQESQDTSGSPPEQLPKQE